MTYYTAMMVMCWLVLGTISILVHENRRMSKEDKHLLYATYALVAAAAFAEWCGVQLDGNTAYPEWLLRIVKCADYVLTPMAAAGIIFQMRLDNLWQKVLVTILSVNVAFQIVAAFGGWMTEIDGNGCYSHGIMYPVYIGICLLIVGVLLIQSIVYGRSFKHQNRKSLYASMLVLLAGIALQECFPGVRTEYLGMTAAAVLMFVHFTEFYQLTTDELLVAQQRALDVDTMTGLRSRYAYAHTMEAYSTDGVVRGGFTAFMMDVNGLKIVNDTLGHDAGDDLICGAADCIKKVFGGIGECFRTGGDEFVVFADVADEKQAKDLLGRLEDETRRWHGESGVKVEIAAGYARAKDNPDATVADLVKIADKKMYSAKDEYYERTGAKRRTV